MALLTQAPTVAKVALPELMGQPNQRFRIPYYQRKYAWTRENCAVLLEDILVAGQQTGQTHFFSNVTLSPLDAGDGYYVVDGQQRLTTFSLLLEALRQEFGDVDALTRPLQEYMLVGELPRLAFEDQVDQRTYRHLLLGYFCDPESTSATMTDNFAYFRKNIRDNRETWRSTLKGGVLERLLFVRVVLPTRMPPQRIFERMNATKLAVEEFDLIKNFLLMKAGTDEQRAVYDRMEENLHGSQTLYWRACIQAMVSMHAQEEIPQDRIYKPFKTFFRDNPARITTALPFLEQTAAWIRDFGHAWEVFNNLGYSWDQYRAIRSDGYGALLMKLVVAFSAPEDVPRRNGLIARMVESIRGYIAVERLHSARMHPRRFDADWTYKSLKASGSGYDKSALADAIEKGDVFSLYPREQIDAAIRGWVNEKLEQQGYVNNAKSIGITGRSTDSAEDAVHRYHEIFAEKKGSLPIANR